MVTPAPYVALILMLAVTRLTRLTGWDTFPPLVRLRRWVTGERTVSAGSTNARLGLTAEQVTATVKYRWPTLAEGLSCAYCSSLWWGTAVYVGWRLEPRWTLYAAVPLALSAVVGAWARWLDP